MFNAKVIDNFLSTKEVNTLLEYAKSVSEWETGGSEFWSNRSLNAINIMIKNKEVGNLLYNIRQKIANQILKEYNLKEIYPDLFQMVRWFPGQEQPPHADDMKNTKGTEWFHHREFGAIIYLNKNYTGGKTYYPNYGIEIQPEPGRLAIHPGDENHLHGVTKIENGMRYTLASFWTQDKTYFDGWVI